MKDFEVSQTYKDNIARWVKRQMASPDADSYNKLALKISQRIGSSLAAQQLNRWAIGDFIRRIQDPTLEKLARYEGVSLDSFRLMLEGNGPEVSTSHPKPFEDVRVTAEDLRLAFAALPLFEALDFLEFQIGFLKQQVQTGRCEMRYFRSVKDLLLDAFEKCGYSQTEGLLELKKLYISTDPNEKDRLDSYLAGVDAPKDNARFYHLANALSRLTGITYNIEDVRLLRCPVCDETTYTTKHTVGID